MALPRLVNISPDIYGVNLVRGPLTKNFFNTELAYSINTSKAPQAYRVPYIRSWFFAALWPGRPAGGPGAAASWTRCCGLCRSPWQSYRFRACWVWGSSSILAHTAIIRDATVNNRFSCHESTEHNRFIQTSKRNCFSGSKTDM